MVMDDSNENTTLEIADLEYEVGGMGAVERGDSRVTNDAIVVWYVTPN